MHPNNDLLTKFTVLAKSVIYDKQRMEKFMNMMGTADGALVAVQTVIGAIEQAKPIPPDVLQQLGVNIYLLLVDMAQHITGVKPGPNRLKQVISKIIDTLSKPQSPQPAQGQMPPQAQAQPPQQQRPMGILAGGAQA